MLPFWLTNYCLLVNAFSFLISAMGGAKMSYRCKYPPICQAIMKQRLQKVKILSFLHFLSHLKPPPPSNSLQRVRSVYVSQPLGLKTGIIANQLGPERKVERFDWCIGSKDVHTSQCVFLLSDYLFFSFFLQGLCFAI